MVVIPALSELLQPLLPTKPQGRSVAVGAPPLRSKGCSQVPLESWGGGADPDGLTETGAGGRA